MIEFMQVASSGEIVMHGECPDDQLSVQKMDGLELIEGEGEVGKHYYDWKTRQIREIPPAPNSFCHFDHETKQWAVNKDSALRTLREQRDRLLTQSDWVLLDDVPISESKRSAWRAYRQALRDMPQSTDFENVVWPTKPSDQES